MEMLEAAESSASPVPAAAAVPVTEPAQPPVEEKPTPSTEEMEKKLGEILLNSPE